MVRSQITTFLMKFDTFRKIEGLGQSPGRPHLIQELVFLLGSSYLRDDLWLTVSIATTSSVSFV